MKKFQLRNYSTNIEVEKTINEIEQMLATHGATDILKQYDGAGNVLTVSFMVETPNGKIPFRLPMKVQQASQSLKNLKKAGKINISYKDSEDIDHARKVGWRIIKDWVYSQLSLIEIEMVKVEEVFLPYAYNPVEDATLFELMEKKNFAGMLVEDTEKER